MTHMIHHAQFDRAAFLETRRDLDNKLVIMGARLERYFEKPADVVSLQDARRELQRVLDRLKTLHMEGVVAFCTELGIVLDELLNQPDMFSVLHRDVLRHAMSGLAGFLDELAHGADNAVLRLFSQYQELQQLRGLEMSFELDLFFPDLAMQLPQQVLDADSEGAALKTLRSQYQQGLLQLLRRQEAPAALQSMQQALHDVMCCLPRDNSRAFWWIAGGLLECLRLDGLPPELNARKLLGRVDQQIRALVEGNVGEIQAHLNEMLYQIGRCHRASDMVTEIRQVYALDSCLPEPVTLPLGETSQTLGAMRGLLRVSEESWERCTLGNKAACNQFNGYAGQLAEHGNKLEPNTLQYLTRQIHAFSQYATWPEQARRIGMDMAMALLLLRSGIRHYASLGSGFQEQARILSARMQAAMQQQSDDAQGLVELVHLHGRMQQGDVLAHLYNEMLTNLQYIDQGLSAFFSDTARRGELAGLLSLLGQMQGGLHLASLDQAEQVLLSIQNDVRRFAQGNDIPAAPASQVLAEALRALEDYLQHLVHGQVADVAPLQKSLAALCGMRQAPAQTAEVETAHVTMETAVSEDEELLEVFLEEAQEVLRNMRDNLEVCQLHPGSREPLVDIRRGFHTLKGSGRMVGLNDLAGVAWSVERALGRCLQDNQADNSGLVPFITEATRKFTDWVDALNNQSGASIETDQLIAAAQQIENGIAPDQPAGNDAQQTARPEMPATEASVFSGEAEKPQIQDQVDEQLLRIFLEEAEELCPLISNGLHAWRDQPDDEKQAQLLKRLLHTFKGSARMAGAMHIGEVAHQMEERIVSAVQARAEPALLDALENNFDVISAQLEKLCNIHAGDAPVPQGWREDDQTRLGATGLEYFTLKAAAEHVLPGNMLRVRSDVIDRLVNRAGEISVTHSRMETEMGAFKEGLLELTGSVTRLRKQLREMEIQAESQMQARSAPVRNSAGQFDPLEFDRFTRLQELVRFMNESVHDVQTVQHALLKNYDETAAAITAQSRLGRELQHILLSVRMVPFASIGERLHHIVRQTAKELDKHADLELFGSAVELDRGVLEKMTAPFEHLLRNALVHGLEESRVRAQSGKKSIGQIRLELRHENNEVVFEFSDDGAGLNLAALRDKAQARGLLQPNETASDEQLAQLIFVAGVSTASEVTEVAGRGIGLDVVRSEIAALGGRIDVSSETGAGTKFTIRLPLTLAVTHILTVRSGDVIYAIPSTMVEQVRQMKPEELAQLYAGRRVEWQGRSYAYHYLPHLLGDAGRVPETLPRNTVLLLCSGDQHIALHVDGLLGNQEAVVKNTGPQLTRLPWIAGATVLGNGAVAMILNPAQLVQRNAAAARGDFEAATKVSPARPLVMVVDDSLTVRKIITRQLTRAGYQVVTAKDGVDALEQLDEISPAVMLLDIEMPRMDGFELTRQLRRDTRTQNLPIIMITSRSADKHRDYAMQLGVNAYLGKPYQEEELLQRIAGFVAAPETHQLAESH